MANYPLPKFHFLVEWGGDSIGFTEVSGLDITNEIIEYRDGASPEFSKIKMPGQRKFNNITLKRGIFKKNNNFYTWFNSISMNTVERRDLTLSLLDETGNPVVVWKIRNAWPHKITSTDLKADGNDVAVESLELACEGLVIQNG
ncbi:MAG TPA: phage tail protein [Bacteroidia bacterium]|jgi:phage tail-like protein|nr:phage tail protein [Bacteroidia bacterium]